MTTFRSRFAASLSALVRDGVWIALVGIVFALTFLITGLTLTNTTAQSDGLNAGFMAYSMNVFLLTLIVIIGVPAISIRLRSRLGQQPFLDTYLTTLFGGLAFVLAAFPATLWAIAVGGVPVSHWFATLGTVKLEVWVLALLVTFAQTAFHKEMTASSVALGLVAVIVVGPLVVLGGASLLPGTQQNILTRQIDWNKNGNDNIDPNTGYPVNPSCTNTGTTTRTVARTDLVWPILPMNPLILVSESVEPRVASWVAVAPESGTSYQAGGTDAFSAIVLAERPAQVPARHNISINECDNLAKYGTPYPGNMNGAYDPQWLIDNTRSGYTDGLVGQAIVVALTAGGWFIARRRRS